LLSDGQYVLRDGAKNMSAKDKSTYILVPKRDDEQLSDKSVTLAPAAGTEVLEEESGMAEKLNTQAIINHLTF
jgi:regulator of nonsense transcripts 3